ncbi:VOC family protein [Cryobacterium sp. W22_MBD10_FK3]|uniref:VOC family protein n=1 Tax=Cryobacterium sp. W22_MBD10_FK3 TaxID=3240273 RepID=UPI003F913BA7
MSIPANFTIVTLGVADLTRSIAFYSGLGWEQRGDPSAGITWFRTSGTWIGLFGYAELAADIGVAADLPTGYRGITLALNFGAESEVDAALAEAVAVGARLVKPATRAVWGGYSGYFADPDGHLWEAAYAPGFPVAPDGTIEITD